MQYAVAQRSLAFDLAQSIPQKQLNELHRQEYDITAKATFNLTGPDKDLDIHADLQLDH